MFSSYFEKENFTDRNPLKNALAMTWKNPLLPSLDIHPCDALKKSTIALPENISLRRPEKIHYCPPWKYILATPWKNPLLPSLEIYPCEALISWCFNRTSSRAERASSAASNTGTTPSRPSFVSDWWKWSNLPRYCDVASATNLTSTLRCVFRFGFEKWHSRIGHAGKQHVPSSTFRFIFTDGFDFI